MEYLNETKHEEKEEAGREEATNNESQNAAYSGGRDTHTQAPDGSDISLYNGEYLGSYYTAEEVAEIKALQSASEGVSLTPPPYIEFNKPIQKHAKTNHNHRNHSQRRGQ